MNLHMTDISGLSRDKAARFAACWLPAWTGNDPDGLVSWYSDNCFYRDDAIPDGVTGKTELRQYFSTLLKDNPEWVWMQTDSIPMQQGFVNKWHVSIPVGPDVIEADGICLVQLDSDGKICRNEVYFDRYPLICAINHYRRAG